MKKIILFYMLLTSISHAWIFNNSRNGKLTGYSMPINNDIYKQFEINFDNNNQKFKSPMTDLFLAPNINYDYNSTNTHKQKFGGGVGAKCGVTIIYD